MTLIGTAAIRLKTEIATFAQEPIQNLHLATIRGHVFDVDHPSINFSLLYDSDHA